MMLREFYDVTLIVGNAAGTDEAVYTSYIIVEDIPTADFSSSINDFDVDFNNNSVDSDTYSWDFGDGNGSTK